jgi:hypothetical protein
VEPAAATVVVGPDDAAAVAGVFDVGCVALVAAKPPGLAGTTVVAGAVAGVVAVVVVVVVVVTDASGPQTLA